MTKRLIVVWSMAVAAAVTGMVESFGSPIADSAEPKCLAIFHGIRANEIALSPCERYLAAAGIRAGTKGIIGLALVWDLQTKKVVFRGSHGKGGFDTVAFSPDGKFLAVAGFDDNNMGKAIIWEFPTGKLIASLTNEKSLRCLRFSADGKLIALTTQLPKENCEAIFLWETKTFQKKSILKGPTETIWNCAFSRDNKWLACGDANDTVHLWNFQKEELVKTWSPGAYWVQAVNFSPSGKKFASAPGSQIEIMDMTNMNKSLQVQTGQNGSVKCLLFDATERWLFSGGIQLPVDKKLSGEGTIEVWDLAKKNRHSQFKAHALSVLSMALTRDSQTLFTVGLESDGCVKAWSLPAGFYQKASN